MCFVASVPQGGARDQNLVYLRTVRVLAGGKCVSQSVHFFLLERKNLNLEYK